MLRSFVRRRQQMHGVWKINNITPSHPSYPVDTYCARPSMTVGWCLHRRLRREKKIKNSTHFPSMAVCYATAVGPKKGKSTWGVEIPQYDTAVHHRRRSAFTVLSYSLLRCTTHVPFVLVQNTSQRPYTIDDGLPSPS